MNKAVSIDDSEYRDIMSFTPEQIAAKKSWSDYQVSCVTQQMVSMRKFQRLLPSIQGNKALMEKVQAAAAKQITDARAESAALSAIVRKPK